MLYPTRKRCSVCAAAIKAFIFSNGFACYYDTEDNMRDDDKKMKVSQLKNRRRGVKRESSLSRFQHFAATFRFFSFCLCTCVTLF